MKILSFRFPLLVKTIKQQTKGNSIPIARLIKENEVPKASPLVEKLSYIILIILQSYSIKVQYPTEINGNVLLNEKFEGAFPIKFLAQILYNSIKIYLKISLPCISKA